MAETATAAAHSASVLRHTVTLADALTVEDIRLFPAGNASTLVRRVPWA